MPIMLSPGVYTQEADYSQYVQDSSTCIVGMVGGARRGPVGIPTLVTSQQQLISIFGKPVEGEYGLYSALVALTKVSQLYYTRVVRSGIKAVGGVLGTDKILYYGKQKGADYNGIEVIQSEQDSEDNTFSITVKNASGQTVETYSELNLSSSSEGYVETVINAQSEYIQADVQYSGTYSAKSLVLAGGDDTGKYSRAGVEGTNKVVLRSKYFDSDLDGCVAYFTAPDAYGLFDLTVKDTEGNIIESWDGVSLDSDSPRYVESLINKGSERLVCVVDTRTDAQTGNSVLTLTESTLTFEGGDNGISGLSVSDIIGESTGGGLYSFSNPETISVDVLTAPGWTEYSVIRAGIDIAEKRTDCIFLIDCPFGMSAQDMINWTNATGVYANTNTAFNSSYAAVYWPWLKISDSYTNKDIWLPPSGFVAAQYAYNDEVAHPWNAPAGLERGKITKAIGVELSPTQGERDAIYGNRNVINPIVNFISNGIVIWGQKTTQRTPSALDRVNVRRLMCYLKRNISNVTRNFVFEQNIAATWERWKTTVEPILINAKNNGGLYEYKIVTEATAADIENNRMPIVIYVKPVKAAEFISLTFNIMPYNASFDNV